MKTAPGGRSDAATQDRRVAHRSRLITRAMLYRDDAKSAPVRVGVKDVSLQGVGLESQTPVDLGVRCRLNIEAGPARITWRLRIVRCDKLDHGGYDIGGQFLTSELSPEADASSDDARSFFQ
jgi:hypothetical protein